jgi:hypothetical protein
MPADEIPSWCVWRRGRSAALVIAPHGGRRGSGSLGDAARRERKVNDLHTAHVATELAEALDGALIVNPALDRNELDLNRISQVAGRAPWFLTLIEMLIDDILLRHPRAEVVFVHGWNVVQPKCDIGVGQRLADAAAAALHAEALTVSPEYAAGRLARLQVACAAAGFTAHFGERYPARHPNNLLQIFRCGAPGASAPQLARWRAEGRVEAVQLELGMPLRWPGPIRSAFVAAVAAAFGETDGARDASPDGTSLAPQPGGIQFYDPQAELGLTARVDCANTHIASRLLIFIGRRRLALFIGEDALGHRSGAHGLHVLPEADGFRLRFAGTALMCDDGALYIELEHAFAASRLCPVHLDVRFHSGPIRHCGSVSGWVEVDGERRRIATHALAEQVLPQRAPGAWSIHTQLHASFGAAGALRLRHEFPGSGGMLYERTAAGETAVTVPGLHIAFDGSPTAPRRIVAGDLCCEPLGWMTIARPLGAQRIAHATFGPARFVRGAAEGFGFYEYARAVA